MVCGIWKQENMEDAGRRVTVGVGSIKTSAFGAHPTLFLHTTPGTWAHERRPSLDRWRIEMRNGFLKMEKQIYWISITQVHNVTQTLAWHLIFFVCYEGNAFDPRKGIPHVRSNLSLLSTPAEVPHFDNLWRLHNAHNPT